MLNYMATHNRFNPSLPKDTEQVLYRDDLILVTSELIEAKRSSGRHQFSVVYEMSQVIDVYITNEATGFGANWLGLLIFGPIGVLALWGSVHYGLQSDFIRAGVLLFFGCVFTGIAIEVVLSFFDKKTFFVVLQARPKGFHLLSEHSFSVFSSRDLTEAQALCDDIEICRKRSL